MAVHSQKTYNQCIGLVAVKSHGCMRYSISIRVLDVQSVTSISESEVADNLVIHY